MTDAKSLFDHMQTTGSISRGTPNHDRSAGDSGPGGLSGTNEVEVPTTHMLSDILTQEMLQDRGVQVVSGRWQLCAVPNQTIKRGSTSRTSKHTPQTATEASQNGK